MPVKSEDYNQVCVISVSGEFVGPEIASARQCADDAINNRQMVDIIMDMEKVPFIDSEGLETLLWMKRRCEEVFGQLKLVGLDENCRKIMEITRLDHRLECHDNLESAVKTLR